MNFPFTPESASTTADRVDLLYLVLLGVSLFFMTVVFVPMLWFLIKYRAGSKADRSNPSSGSVLVECGWAFVPGVMGVGLFAWGAVVYFDMQRPPPDAMEIHVVGKQWMWKLQHADGRREINQLHVPVGRNVRLLLASQDVIHSFFVPAFRIKQDAVPGKYTSEWFKATKPGTYHLFCAEFCGTSHSRMIGQIVVMRPDDYQEWLSKGEQSDTLAEAGKRRFSELGCTGCHGASAQVRAPRLEGLFGKPVPLADGTVVRADEQYIHDSILLPAKQITAGYQNLMPSFDGQLNEEQVFELVAYIKSLVNQEPPPQP